jgi:DNA-binding IclR family transcriptional regulator
MSSVVKVFHILETIVSHQERGLAYSEVVAKTQLPKATTHRVLKSLVEMGYVRFNAEAGRYSCDLKLALLGSAVTSHFTLKDFVRPHLRTLQAETGHTCNLGVLDGDAGVYLDKLESPEAFRVRLYSDIGKRFPLHCTGMGKILLAGMRSAEASRILARRLKVFTPHTITVRSRQARAGTGATLRVCPGSGRDHAWDRVYRGADPESGWGDGGSHQRRVSGVYQPRARYARRYPCRDPVCGGDHGGAPGIGGVGARSGGAHG